MSAVHPDTLRVVAQMLGISAEEVPDSLRRLLSAAERLLGRVEGRLASRQAIAAIVVGWASWSESPIADGILFLGTASGPNNPIQ